MEDLRLNEHRKVAIIFDKMAEDYDVLDDLYSYHLNHVLNRIISQEFVTGSKEKRVLDIGSGTGFQTLVYAQIGFSTVGIDVSKRLTRVAFLKAKKAKLGDHALFMVGDATKLPFPDKSFDVINCCGSTLGFVTNYANAIAEMSRVLKKGGKIIIETEQKWNFDHFYVLLGALMGNRLGYGIPPYEVLTAFRDRNKGFIEQWTVKASDGSIETLRIRLFTYSELKNALEKNNIVIRKIWGIHIFTNLIPYIFMEDPKWTRLKPLFSFLEKIDQAVFSKAPFNRFGVNLVIMGDKG